MLTPCFALLCVFEGTILGLLDPFWATYSTGLPSLASSSTSWPRSTVSPARRRSPSPPKGPRSAYALESPLLQPHRRSNQLSTLSYPFSSSLPYHQSQSASHRDHPTSAPVSPRPCEAAFFASPIEAKHSLEIELLLTHLHLLDLLALRWLRACSRAGWTAPRLRLRQSIALPLLAAGSRTGSEVMGFCIDLAYAIAKDIARRHSCTGMVRVRCCAKLPRVRRADTLLL